MNPMPNAFMTINLSAPSPAETPAAVYSPSRPLGDVAAGPIESQAKATKGNAGMAGAIIGPVRRSTAGTGLQVGEASADLPATSEIMDVTDRRDGHSIYPSPSNKGGNSEAPAVDASNPKAAGLHVKYAARRREKAGEHRFILDEAWFMAMLDEPPLFLQEGA